MRMFLGTLKVKDNKENHFSPFIVALNKWGTLNVWVKINKAPLLLHLWKTKQVQLEYWPKYCVLHQDHISYHIIHYNHPHPHHHYHSSKFIIVVFQTCSLFCSRSTHGKWPHWMLPPLSFRSKNNQEKQKHSQTNC